MEILKELIFNISSLGGFGLERTFFNSLYFVKEGP